VAAVDTAVASASGLSRQRVRHGFRTTDRPFTRLTRQSQFLAENICNCNHSPRAISSTGSSGGGVGAQNHVTYLRKQIFDPNATAIELCHKYLECLKY
jgi:hypothetical protein